MAWGRPWQKAAGDTGTSCKGGWWKELQNLSGCCEGSQRRGLEAGCLAQVPARPEIKEHFLGEEEEEAVLGKEVIQSHLCPALPESTPAPCLWFLRRLGRPS